MPQSSVKLLIIGAGPYGLAQGIVARNSGVDYCIVGKPMEFWTAHMPRGMNLRTPCDWLTETALPAYQAAKGLADAPKPVPAELFADYLQTVAVEKSLAVTAAYVIRLERDGGRFRAWLDNGDRIDAEQVVVATGYYPYKYIPDELRALLPFNRYAHAADATNFEALKDRRCLIVGGRQSAYEWAGLLARYAQRVDVVHRHETPAFAPSDWSWAYAYIERTRIDPGWYKRIPQTERDAIQQRFWNEGRLQLEDWLLDKLAVSNVHSYPNAAIAACMERPDGVLDIALDNGRCLQSDFVTLATGYRVDVRKLPFLAAGKILPELAIADGFPALDDTLQSDIPGLYFTGIHAVGDFGPFFFFVACAFAAADIIMRKLA
ncbi:MAG: NAD(P)-binding domain-containing protein [Gammaproteobacteria bacterium]